MKFGQISCLLIPFVYVSVFVCLHVHFPYLIIQINFIKINLRLPGVDHTFLHETLNKSV